LEGERERERERERGGGGKTYGAAGRVVLRIFDMVGRELCGFCVKSRKERFCECHFSHLCVWL